MQALLDGAVRPDLNQETVQLKAISGDSEDLKISPPQSSGTSLPDPLRRELSQFFKMDLSAVRIHQDPHAESFGILAYTRGTNIYFSPGRYEPSSKQGLQLLGHELAHVIQQIQGRVPSAMLPDGTAINMDPGLEREADELGAKAASQIEQSPASGDASGSLQARQEQTAPRAAGSNPVQFQLTDYDDFDVNKDSGNVSWSEHRTQLDKNRRADGLEAETSSGDKWQTEIEWSPSHTSKDGVTVEAKRLGPDHRLGSAPDCKVATDRVNELHTAAGGKAGQTKLYVAGHLLNNELGGPGDREENLAPIPRDTNSKHENEVEQHVKKLVNHQHAWVYYKVEIKHAEEKDEDDEIVIYPSALISTWYQLKPAKKQKAAAKASTSHSQGDAVEVPGTRSEVILSIPPPSRLKSSKGTNVKVKEKGKNDIQDDTNLSQPDFDQTILDSTEKIKARLLVLRPLMPILKNISVKDLSDSDHSNVEEVIKEIYLLATPSPVELEAHAEISDATAGDIADLDRLKISDALGVLEKERHARKDMFNAGLRSFFKADSKLLSLLEGVMNAESVEWAKLRDLANALIAKIDGFAEEEKQKQEELQGITNKLRAALGLGDMQGKADVDTAVSTAQQVEQVKSKLSRSSFGGAVSPGKLLPLQKGNKQGSGSQWRDRAVKNLFDDNLNALQVEEKLAEQEEPKYTDRFMQLVKNHKARVAEVLETEWRDLHVVVSSQLADHPFILRDIVLHTYYLPDPSRFSETVEKLEKLVAVNTSYSIDNNDSDAPDLLDEVTSSDDESDAAPAPAPAPAPASKAIDTQGFTENAKEHLNELFTDNMPKTTQQIKDALSAGMIRKNNTVKSYIERLRNIGLVADTDAQSSPQ